MLPCLALLILPASVLSAWINSTTVVFQQVPPRPRRPLYTAYSAYVDRRVDAVRIFGLADAQLMEPIGAEHPEPKFSCRLAEGEGTSPGSCRTIESYFLRSKGEMSDPPYSDAVTVILKCPLSSSEANPFKVVLYADLECADEPIHIIISIPPPSPKVEIAVCLSPRVGWDAHLEVLKSVPVFRALGAGIVTVYAIEPPPPSLQDSMKKEFNKSGVEVIPFDVLSIDAFPYYLAERVALNDCMLRNSLRADWVGVFDTDEYPLPLDPYKNWADILKNVPAEAGYLSFLHAYCPPGKGIKAVTEIPKLCHRPQTENGIDRYLTKSFSRPNVTITLFNHFPDQMVDGWFTPHIVPVEEGSLFHVRKERFRPNKFRKANKTFKTAKNWKPRWLLEHQWIVDWWGYLRNIAKNSRKKEKKGMDSRVNRLLKKKRAGRPKLHLKIAKEFRTDI